MHGGLGFFHMRHGVRLLSLPGTVVSTEEKQEKAVPVMMLLLFFAVYVARASSVCDVTRYGAVGDGKTQNIAAFLSAIDACADGGVVRVPSPGVFLAAPFNLSSHQILEIQRGATLLGTTNVSLVPLMKPFPSMGGDITRDGHPCRYAPLVGAFNATNVSVTGGGVIDGNGAWWWSMAGTVGNGKW